MEPSELLSELGKVTYCKEFSSGFNNIAYDIVLDGRPLVLKVMKTPEAQKHVEKDKHAFAFVKALGIPVPEVVHSGVDPVPYVLLTRLAGKPLCEVYASVDREKVFTQLGEYRGRMHAVRYDQFGFFDEKLQLTNSFSDWHAHQLGRVGKILDKLGEVPEHRGFWEQYNNLYKVETPSFCHGDPGFSNVIVDGDEITGIIDFEFAQSGSMVRDTFKNVRNFKWVYEHRYVLQKAHEEHVKFPKEWEQLMLLYQWQELLKVIGNVDSITWRGLDEEKTLKRRQIIKEEWSEAALRIVKEFPKYSL